MGFERTFDVYRHPIKGYQAVKRGFSWPAFFYSFIWSLFKGLWAIAFMIFLAVVALDVVGHSLAGAVPVAGLVTWLAQMGVAIFVGRNGNGWRREDMLGKGFVPVGTVQAGSPAKAVSQVAAAPPEG
ncbi:MAG: DUF2628 domain-containing protein [Nitrospirae bacterium]|nr:DUF2628 domain-containing protein [Nitrospirota bacterium]